MDWYITSPDTNAKEYQVEASDWELTRYLDASRPSQGKVVVPRKTPAIKKSWIRAVEDGQTKFLGYISRKPAISGAKKTIEVRGVEALLWERYAGNYGYPGNDFDIPYIRLQHIFSSDPPNQGYDRWHIKGSIGLLWYAQSKIPLGRGYFTKGYVPFPYGGDPRPLPIRGPWHLFDFDEWVYRLPGGGKKSRLGTKNIYINGSLITEEATYAAMKASSSMAIYRDDNDLYAKPYDSSGLYLGELNNDWFADMAFDCRIRLGTLDKYDDYITAPLKTGFNRIGDILTSIAPIHDLNVRWRYAGNICYMDVLEDFDDDGIFSIKGEDCEEINYEMQAELEPDCVLCLGEGSDQVRQALSVVDLSPGGAYIEKISEFDGGFADPYGSLHDLALAEWHDTRKGELITVQGKDFGCLIPGNTVELETDEDGKIEYTIHRVLLQARKSPTISLGGREVDIIDAVRSQNKASNIYLQQGLVEMGSTTPASGNITIGDLDTADTPYTSPSFTAPAYSTVSGRKPRWLLDVTISPPANTYIPQVFCTFWVCVYSSTTGIDTWVVPNGGTQWYLLCDSVNKIDITNWINWGGTNYIRVHCRYRGYWSGTAPVCTCSISSKLYARRVV